MTLVAFDTNLFLPIHGENKLLQQHIFAFLRQSHEGTVTFKMSGHTPYFDIYMYPKHSPPTP